VAVREGDPVARGDVLLEVEDQLPQARAREAQAVVDAALRRQAQAEQAVTEKELKLAQQQAILRAMERRLHAAQLTRDRARDRVQENLANPADLKVAEALVEEIEAQIQAEQARGEELRHSDPRLEVQRAEADVRAAQARLDQAVEARSQCVLRAPADGTVLRLLVSEGDLIGNPRSEPAVRFWPADRPLIIRAEIDQESAAGLGEHAEARFWDYFRPESCKGTGHLRRIGDWFAPQRTVLDEPLRFKEARTLECIIDTLKCADDVPKRTLRIGQRMRVEIVGDGPAR
jgi:multidrug resistance efflux pump